MQRLQDISVYAMIAALLWIAWSAGGEVWDAISTPYREALDAIAQLGNLGR